MLEGRSTRPRAAGGAGRAPRAASAGFRASGSGARGGGSGAVTTAGGGGSGILTSTGAPDGPVPGTSTDTGGGSGCLTSTDDGGGSGAATSVGANTVWGRDECDTGHSAKRATAAAEARIAPPAPADHARIVARPEPFRRRAAGIPGRAARRRPRMARRFGTGRSSCRAAASTPGAAIVAPPAELA